MIKIKVKICPVKYRVREYGLESFKYFADREQVLKYLNYESNPRDTIKNWFDELDQKLRASFVLHCGAAAYVIELATINKDDWDRVAW